MTELNCWNYKEQKSKQQECKSAEKNIEMNL